MIFFCGTKKINQIPLIEGFQNMWVIYCNGVYGAATRQGGEHLIRLARAGRPAYKNTKRRIFTQENCYRYNQRCIVIRYFGLTILDWMWMCASLPSWIRGQSREVAILWRRGARTPQIPLCTRAKKEKKTISGGGGAGRPTASGPLRPKRGRVWSSHTRPRLRLRVAVVVSRNARAERRIPRTVSSSSSSSSPLPPHKSTLLSKTRRRRRIKPSFGGIFCCV